MTVEIAAMLVLILAGLLIFVIDTRLWQKATDFRDVWRWLEVPWLKDRHIRLVNLLIIPIVLTSGVLLFVQLEGSTWAKLVFALAGLLILKHVLFWERYVRLHEPKVVEVEEGTTIWDVAKVVLVPAVLSLGILWLNIAQANRQDRIEDARRAAQSTTEADRVQENAFQTYLDRMSELLLAENGLRSPNSSDDVRDIARARTLTVLQGLDGERKGALIGFLSEAELITSEMEFLQELNTSDTITRALDIVMSGTITRAVDIQLSGADLSGANLRKAKLYGADLSAANLFMASLLRADLRGADLRGADLNEANLSEANLLRANLRGADLRKADLSGANLVRSNLCWANLNGADLSEANLSLANLELANLNGADLFKAALRLTDLVGAELNGANLSRAKLHGARLHGTDLSGTKLENASYDKNTTWPEGFDPERTGAILVDVYYKGPITDTETLRLPCSAE
jgi:uncharacterized protein YjbI with pentapeptide repeats